MLLRTLLVCLVLTGPAVAQTADDHLAIVATADALDTAVDAKDWDGARALFTDDIVVTLPGVPATSQPADDLIGQWSTYLYPEKTSFHLRGNHLVTFHSPTSATLKSKGYAWNHLPDFDGGALWEVWGDYVYDVEKTDGTWKLTSFAFSPVHQRGNPAVPAHLPQN